MLLVLLQSVLCFHSKWKMGAVEFALVVVVVVVVVVVAVVEVVVLFIVVNLFFGGWGWIGRVAYYFINFVLPRSGFSDNLMLNIK